MNMLIHTECCVRSVTIVHCVKDEFCVVYCVLYAYYEALTVAVEERYPTNITRAPDTTIQRIIGRLYINTKAAANRKSTTSHLVTWHLYCRVGYIVEHAIEFVVVGDSKTRHKIIALNVCIKHDCCDYLLFTLFARRVIIYASRL